LAGPGHGPAYSHPGYAAHSRADWAADDGAGNGSSNRALHGAVSVSERKRWQSDGKNSREC
jgi:hypothetical protein